MHRQTTDIITAQKLRERAGYFYKYTCVRSIDLSVLGEACREIFCAFGDFYASGMQDAKVPKSLEVYCTCSLLRLLDFLYIVQPKKLNGAIASVNSNLR